MSDITLTHKSHKYADKIITHIPMDKPSERYLRIVILKVWQDAWAEATAAQLSAQPYHEDMGR